MMGSGRLQMADGGWRISRGAPFPSALGPCGRRRPRERIPSALLLWVLPLCLAGCGDQVRALTPEEQLAFRQAGSITPVLDMERIERAILKTGPYRVVPGDILEVTMPALLQAVTVAEVQSTQRGVPVVNPYLLRVRDNGTIALPAVGPMKVAGLPLSQIEERITEAYQDYVIPHPSVFVRVAEYKTERVYVAGAVKTPGVYTLQADQMTLSSLLTRAGGVSEAGAAVVRILRSERPADDFGSRSPVKAGDDMIAEGGLGKTPATNPPGNDPQFHPVASDANDRGLADDANDGGFNPPSAIRNPQWGRPAAKPILLPVVGTNIPYRDVALDEGDSVVVEPVQMPVFSVLGLVMKSDNFPYPPGAQYNLAQAIAFAGGLDPAARPSYVTIYRLNADGSVVRAPFRLLQNDKFTEALATPIRPGDVVAVEHTPRTRMNAAVRDLLNINFGLYITGEDLWDNNN